MVTDPFWALYEAKIGTDITILREKWNNLETNDGQTLFDIVSDLLYNDPSLSSEEIARRRWLIFQGFYQNFKRAHLKVFYQQMTADSRSGCDPTAIDILLPELAGTNNINLDGLTLSNLAYTNPAIFGPQGGEDQWEKTWLGYTGTANCGDWAENMTVLLETKIGQCNGDWSLDEPIRSEIKDLFLTYCNAQKGQPLANAFKKLYYSPYVTYKETPYTPTGVQGDPWMPEILDNQTAWIYVQIYKTLAEQYPDSDLQIAFEAHFGEGSLDEDATYWDQNYSTDEQKELVRAYVESMIRAVYPRPVEDKYYADYDGDNTYDDEDEYSIKINKALNDIKDKVPADCISAFYAMLSVPDCKSSTYQEVEIPAATDDLVVSPTETGSLLIAKNGIIDNPLLIPHDDDYGYYPADHKAFMIEMTVDIDQLNASPQQHEKIVLLHNPYADIKYEGNFEMGYMYYEEYGGYCLYYHLQIKDLRNSGLGYTKRTKTGHSNRVFAINEITEPHNLVITQAMQADLEVRDGVGGTQNIYYNGCLVIFDGGISPLTSGFVTVRQYKAGLFPLRIANKLFSVPPFPFTIAPVTSSASINVKELRIWKNDENFTREDVEKNFKLSTLEPYQTQDQNLLAYFTFDSDTYTDEGQLIRLKDKSYYRKDMVASKRNRDNTQTILQQEEMSCLLEDCRGNVVKPKTIKKFLHICEDAYTFGDGVDLWGGRPLTPPTAEELQAECERVTKDLLGDFAERLLVKQKEAIEAKVNEAYRNQCFNSPFKETFTLKYAKKEYHYTLYYYDQAGNLVQTVPPEGIDKTWNANHTLKTKYTYNTLGQVVWQETPDAGQSKFWIDYYGRVKLSQNAEQAIRNDYAYSKFDELGRPYEVGKLNTGTTSLNDGQVDIEELTFDSDFPIAIQTPVAGSVSTINFTLSQRTKTFYDKHDDTGIVNPNEQKNLKNRVAAVVVIEEGENIGAVTRYSYDIHGNVEKLWQKLPQETGLPEKTVEYNYDLLSGKVNEVIYNRGGEKDEFRHRYSYDGDNRLTQVETSLDGYHWTREASYFYYAHGPLARIETGEHNLQGTDYFYTLQGWIKGVNAIGLNAENDLGKDGAELSTFSKDEYAYTLNYFEGDYIARGSIDRNNDLLGDAFEKNEIYSNFQNYQDELGNSPYKRESLYNGNIAAMATSIGKMEDLAQPITQSMNYRYDQLHRIAAAEASTWTGTQWQGTNGAYRTSYKYDANGNIDNLKRYNGATTPQLIDDLTYTYYDHIDTNPIKNPPLVADRLKVDMQNRLWQVEDLNGTAEGLGNTGEYEYEYDLIGNLTKNTQDGIENIVWNIYGKVEKVTKRFNVGQFERTQTIVYKYDGTGNRISKSIRTSGESTYFITSYVRDASGNVMAIYTTKREPDEVTQEGIYVKEIPIYGSSRLGQYRPKTDAKKTALGQRIYEFSNHLGNVLVTLTDNKVPQTDGTYSSVVLSASDYYPFGMAMKERTFENSEYRYGFNGKENDIDFGSHIQDYGFRLYSRESARFLSVDPLTRDYPELTTYQFASNTPIQAVDLDGLEAKYVTLYLEKMDDGTHTVSKTEVTIYQNIQILKDGEKHAATYVTYVVDGESYSGETLYEKITENGMTPSAAYDYTQSEIEGKFTDDWSYVFSGGSMIDLYKRDINAPDSRGTVEDLEVLDVLGTKSASSKNSFSPIPKVSNRLDLAKIPTSNLVRKGTTRYSQLQNKLKAIRNTQSTANNKNGNRTLSGTITQKESEYLGRKWVGEGYKTITTKKGNTLYLSKDGKRVYRAPTPKNSPYTKTGTQANFEKRSYDPNKNKGKGGWNVGGNAHIDVNMKKN